MLDITAISYKQLQQLAKNHNIKANQKQQVLINELIKLYPDLYSLESVDTVDISTVFINTFNNITQTPNNTVNTPTVNTPTVNTPTVNTPTVNTPTVNTPIFVTPNIKNKTIYHIENIEIVLNGVEIAPEHKQTYVDWLYSTYDNYYKNESSRIINNLTDDILSIQKIDIQMTQAFDYRHDKNNKLRQVKSVKGRNLTASLNKNKTEFAYGIISPPTHKENAIVSNRKETKPIFWGIYDNLPYIDNDTVKYNRDYDMWEHVEFIRVNDKPIIGTIGKLKTQTVSNRVNKVNPNNKLKLNINNNSIQQFKVILKQDDLFSDILGVNREVKIQLIIENNIMYLYQVHDNFTASNNVRDKYSIYKSCSTVQKLHKLCKVCVLEYTEIDVYRWIPIHPRYESIANSLNVYGNPDLTMFKNIQLLQDRVVIGDRILVEKRYIGKSIKIVPIFNKDFLTNGNYKYSCQWIVNIVNKSINSVVQKNTLLIQESNNNFDSEQLKIVQHKYKTLLTTFKKVVRDTFTDLSIINPSYTGLNESDVLNCAESMLNYLIKHCNIANKSDLIGIAKKITGLKCEVYNIIHNGILNNAIKILQTKYKSRYSEILDNLLFTRNYSPKMIDEYLIKNKNK